MKMHKVIVWTGLVVAALLAPSMAVSQSLADVARVEEARRKATKAPAKIYTNDDLRRGGEAAPAAGTIAKPGTPPTASSGSTSQSARPAESVQESGKDEKYWRGRISEARSAVQRNQAFHDALQSQINGLYAEFVGKDDPAQRALVETKRLEAIAQQTKVKAEIAAQTKAIADIEDEARRAGVPAGWLR